MDPNHKTLFPDNREVPFLFYLLPILMGILLSRSDASVNVLFVGITLILVLCLSWIQMSYRYRHVRGILINLALIIISFTNSALSTRLPHFKADQQVYELKVISEKTNLPYVNIVGERRNGDRLLIKFKSKQTKIQTLKGSEILCKCSAKRIQNKVGSTFDNEAYYSSQKVYYECWSKNVPLSTTESIPGINEILSKRIDFAFGTTALSSSMAKAMLLGSKNDIAKQDLLNFKRAGAMHVLAVSGLHVGILFLVLGSLLRFPHRYTGVRWIQTVVLIICITGYAGITNWSPSVSRASLMIIIIIIGKCLQRSSHTLNSVFFSAVVMLIWDPTLIYNIGFQLSYSAVIGILLLYPHLRVLVTGSKLINIMWQMFCVSLSAQIFTLPLVLYHFGTISLSGLLSSYLVIPMASLVIYTSMSGLIVSVFTNIPIVLLIAYETVLSWISEMLALIGSVPLMYLSGLECNLVELCTFYLIIMSTLYGLIHSRSRPLIISMALGGYWIFSRMPY